MINGAIAEAVRGWATQRRLERPHLDRWLALDEDSAAALLDAARSLRLRTGQLQESLGMLEEIGLVDEVPLSAVLARPPLKRILEGSGAAPARARLFVDELRTMRFPRLRRTLDRMKVEIAGLKLPHAVTVVLPKDLGSDELRIEIRARSGAEFKDSLMALSRGAPGLERILEMLGGDYEF